MKKIYQFAAFSLLAMGLNAQTFNFHTQTTGHLATFPYETIQKHKSVKPQQKTAGGAFNLLIDPPGDLIEVANVSSNVSLSGFPIFMDSSATYSSGSAVSYVNACGVGTTMDPKSVYINKSGTFDPMLSRYDAYTLDSIYIYGSYVKTDINQVDTLAIYITWGDTSNTTAYFKAAMTGYSPPMNSWGGTFVAPKIVGHGTAFGNNIRPSATNRIRIPYQLTNNDSVMAFPKFKRIGIKLPTPQLIPAGNIVSAYYTFAPGAAYALGDIVFADATAATPQNKNGFAAIIYTQTNPPSSSPAQYMFDKDGRNGGNLLRADDRHLTGSSFSIYTPQFTLSPLMEYHITGNSTVGINEMQTKGFELGQNRPNPFTGETTISYNLAKEAKVVMLQVLDVAGRLQLEVYETPTIGIHSIIVKDLAPGVYYYSLDVDGVVTTKKMIVQ